MLTNEFELYGVISLSNDTNKEEVAAASFDRQITEGVLAQLKLEFQQTLAQVSVDSPEFEKFVAIGRSLRLVKLKAVVVDE